jgi:hypothetical protein
MAQTKLSSRQVDIDAIRRFIYPSIDQTVSGMTVEISYAESQDFGDVCFINSSEEASLADATDTSKAPGLLLHTGLTTINDTAYYLLTGLARDDTWTWTPGGALYLSVAGTTGNTLTQTAPNQTDEVVQVLGYALSPTVIYFNPNTTIIELA